jgi:hypothetical protein
LSQTVDRTEYGFEDLIGNSKAPTFEQGFGEQISPMLGNIAWRNTDLHIPMDGPDIKISRSLTTSRFYLRRIDHSPSEIFDWTLDVPKLHFNYWGISQSATGACGESLVKNVQVVVPGIDGFDPVGRKQNGVSYPANTVIQYANNWLLVCETFTSRSISVKVNGQAMPATGQQYVLYSPNGKRYHFRFHANRWIFPGINQQKLENVFKTRVFYVTDIQDKFGNWLAYDYKQVITNAALDEMNEPKTSHLLLTKIRSSEGVTVNLSNNGTDITGFSYGGNIVSYTPITMNWSGPAPPTVHLHKVNVSSSNSNDTWTYEHEEFGQPSPSGYFSDKALRR